MYISMSKHYYINVVQVCTSNSLSHVLNTFPIPQSGSNITSSLLLWLTFMAYFLQQLTLSCYHTLQRELPWASLCLQT